MANSRHHESRKKLQSGTSRVKLPELLPYPDLLPASEYIDNVKDILCYVIEHYGNNGLSALIYRNIDTDQLVLSFSDWDGNLVDIQSDDDLAAIANQFVSQKFAKFSALMNSVGITHAQFYFAIVDSGLLLVDIRTAADKLVSPGFVKEIFGNICDVQKTLKIEAMTEDPVRAILEGTGSYSGDLILKPSRFRNLESSKPLYLEVKR